MPLSRPHPARLNGIGISRWGLSIVDSGCKSQTASRVRNGNSPADLGGMTKLINPEI